MESNIDIIPLYIPEAHLILGTIFGIIAFLFRNDNKLKKFIISCIFCMGACFTLALAATASHYFGFTEKSLSTLSWILVCSFQSEFFTWSSIIMINPKYKAKRVLRSLGISAGGFCIVLLVAIIFSIRIYQYAIYLFQALFIYQLCRYTQIFHKEYKEKIAEVENAYDEDLEFKFQWIRSMFIISTIAGIISLICSFFDNFHVYYFAIAINPLFYLYCLSSHLKYISKADSYFKMNAHMSHTKSTSGSEIEKSEALSTFNSEIVKQAVDNWVKAEGYLNPETTVDEIAYEMGITRNDLNQYFSSILNVQFRSWRIQLRIEKAVQILTENPAITTSELCERTGYNDRNNFYKHFQRVTGKSYAKFRDEIRNN